MDLASRIATAGMTALAALAALAALTATAEAGRGSHQADPG
jgi:hypothetical protein